MRWLVKKGGRWMSYIAQTRIFESVPERDGRRYVTYVFKSSFNDEFKVGPILEEADVDITAKAAAWEASILEVLEEREKGKAVELIIEEGVDPADLVFKYADKRQFISDLYSKTATSKEEEARIRLGKMVNMSNKIKLFLGLI